MNIIVLDFETYYDRDFGFSKMTTEEYVRHPRFQVIGVAAKVNNGDTVWHHGPNDVSGFIDSLDIENSMVVCQNTAFDGLILKHHFGKSAKAWADTMGMSRALLPHDKSHSLAAQASRIGVGTKGDTVNEMMGLRWEDFSPRQLAVYGEYCKNDVELTFKLFQHYMAMGFPLVELRLIDLTLRMFIEPTLRLDPAALVSHLRSVKDHKEDLMTTLNEVIAKHGTPEMIAAAFGGDGDIRPLLMSNPQFALLLESFGVVPPTKISQTTGKETFAFAKTDEEFKALLEHEDPKVQALVSARLGIKTTLEETRTERFLDMCSRGSFPVPLRYYGTHTGRWSGQDNVNLQNLPSRGAQANKLKRAILPPEGHIFIDCDSSQIEARTLAWLSGQMDLVTAFENKEDVYKIMASAIYKLPIEQIDTPKRFVGKTVILGAGYGVGHVKLRTYLKVQANAIVDEAESKRIVDTYRAKYFRIPELWKAADRAIAAMAQGQSGTLDPAGLVKVEKERLLLPNGLSLQYPDLRRVQGADGARWVYTSKGQAVDIYGGKLVENCIAGGTLVLAQRGWVPIEQIRDDDLVHDGVEFVPHGGVVFKSKQTCISIDGVLMTPDHEVLTNEGWKPASQNPEPYRPELRDVDCLEPSAQQRAETVLDVPLQMRGGLYQGGRGCAERGEEGRDTELWLRHHAPYFRGERATWDEQAPSLRGVPRDDRQVSAPIASSMGTLWRAWDYCMRRLGFGVSRLLEGHGAIVSAGVGFRSAGQRWSVLPRELPLGIASSEYHEQAHDNPVHRCTYAKHRDRDSKVNAVLQAAQRVEGRGITSPPSTEQPVYDILDAGPRHRFVVLGQQGPFIVHNCCQALARIIIGEQMIRISRRYKPVMTVHDAVAVTAPAQEATEARAFVEACMSWRPKWAADLPLACESGMGATYGDC